MALLAQADDAPAVVEALEADQEARFNQNARLLSVVEGDSGRVLQNGLDAACAGRHEGARRPRQLGANQIAKPVGVHGPQGAREGGEGGEGSASVVGGAEASGRNKGAVYFGPGEAVATLMIYFFIPFIQ